MKELNYSTYFERMSKNISEKVDWWTNILNSRYNQPKVIIDFGCADCSTMGYIIKNSSYSVKYYINIDKASVLKQSKILNDAIDYSTYFYKNINSGRGIISAYFIPLTDNFNEFNSTIENIFKDICYFENITIKELSYNLLCSSVLHEVIHYNKEFTNELKLLLAHESCKYIIIRDMEFIGLRAYIPTSKIIELTKHLIEQNHIDYYNEWIDYCKTHELTINNFLQFCLKYSYTDNWEHEKEENYFVNWRQHLIQFLEERIKYNIIYDYHYSIPYLNDKIKNDLNIINQYDTHCNLIIEKSL